MQGGYLREVSSAPSHVKDRHYGRCDSRDAEGSSIDDRLGEDSAVEGSDTSSRGAVRNIRTRYDVGEHVDTTDRGRHRATDVRCKPLVTLGYAPKGSYGMQEVLSQPLYVDSRANEGSGKASVARSSTDLAIPKILQLAPNRVGPIPV